MTIVLLASVSLFALVVSSRPTLSDPDLSDYAPTSSKLQTALQVAFRTDPGPADDLKLDAGRFQVHGPKQQVEYLSELDPESIPSFEALLEGTAGKEDAFDTKNELVDSRADHVANEPAASEPVVGHYQEVATDETPSTPLVVLAFSCAAAFLALVCVALTLYIIKSVRSQMLVSKRAWELLPHFCRHPRSQENASATAKGHLLGEGRLLPQTEAGELRPNEGSAEMHGLRTEDKPLYFNTVSDMESEWDDSDEKYQDALDMTRLPLIHDLPLEEHASHQSHFDNPPLPPPSESRPLDQQRGDCGAPLRDLRTSRPDWSVRAIDSPVLGLSSREGGGIDSTLQPLIHPHRRAYRSAVPEFDIALAMQLRPGLGIGVDSAWMVRFLMAIFGWFAVALTGNSTR